MFNLNLRRCLFTKRDYPAEGPNAWNRGRRLPLTQCLDPEWDQRAGVRRSVPGVGMAKALRGSRRFEDAAHAKARSLKETAR